MNTTKFLQTQLLLKPPLLPPKFHPTTPLQPYKKTSLSIQCSTTNNENPSPAPAPPPAPEAEEPYKVEIRFKRGLRRRQKDEENPQNDVPKKAKVVKPWEEMSFSEKALELYVGEKGALFWLNKFAYASIYIIIGAWILFRFVGPALNLYQLDTPPLAPQALFKG